jgi:hypothetical protein
MSLSAEQPSIWTPEVIATIIYRIVMILVSLAFIWKKYRRPTRQIDGKLSNKHIMWAQGLRLIRILRGEAHRRSPTFLQTLTRPDYICQ